MTTKFDVPGLRPSEYGGLQGPCLMGDEKGPRLGLSCRPGTSFSNKAQQDSVTLVYFCSKRYDGIHKVRPIPTPTIVEHSNSRNTRRPPIESLRTLSSY